MYVLLRSRKIGEIKKEYLKFNFLFKIAPSFMSMSTIFSVLPLFCRSVSKTIQVQVEAGPGPGTSTGGGWRGQRYMSEYIQNMDNHFHMSFYVNNTTLEFAEHFQFHFLFVKLYHIFVVNYYCTAL